MIKWLCCYSLLLLFSLSGYAQNGVNITGVVKDKKGGTIPGAGIFLSGYKIATVSDQDGKFALTGIKPGNYDVLVQMMGYKPFSKNVIIADKSAQINVLLEENTIQLNEVIIKADPDRPYYLQQFREYFIGKTPNAEKCKILNPEVIQTDYDKEKKMLRVTANEFLIIENKALGYRIKYMLEYFERDFKENIIFYGGHPSFEDLKGSKSKKREWLQKREIAYAGSTQHFFKSLYKNTTKEEGFIIYKQSKITNKNRPSDSTINAHVKRFSRPQSNVIRLGPGVGFSSQNDSLNYWVKMRNLPKFINILNRAEVLTDTLARPLYKDTKTMNFPDALYVIYTGERETENYTNFSGHSIMRPLDISNYQISVVHMTEAPVHFYANGGIFNPRSLLMEGFWAYEKVADMVPMDYIPITKKP